MAIGWILRVDPPRHDHHRQPLGQVAQHLEAGAAAAEHDGGLQHGGRHAAVEQDAPDLLAAAQVRRELLALRRQPAEVDDAAHAGLPWRTSANVVAASRSVLLELGARRRSSGRGSRRRRRRPERRRRLSASVTSATTTSTSPTHGASRSRDRRAGHRPDRPAGRQQLGDEPPADVAAGAGHEGAASRRVLHATSVPPVAGIKRRATRRVARRARRGRCRRSPPARRRWRRCRRWRARGRS